MNKMVKILTVATLLPLMGPAYADFSLNFPSGLSGMQVHGGGHGGGHGGRGHGGRGHGGHGHRGHWHGGHGGHWHGHGGRWRGNGGDWDGGGYYYGYGPGYYGYSNYNGYDNDCDWVPGHRYHGYWIRGHWDC